MCFNTKPIPHVHSAKDLSLKETLSYHFYNCIRWFLVSNWRVRPAATQFAGWSHNFAFSFKRVGITAELPLEIR